MRCFMYGFTIITRYRRMALPFLGGLCFAVAHLPAIAANHVNVTVNPTTGYFEAGPRTYRVPPNVTMSPVKDVSAVIVEKLPGGGLAQPISSGIEITALKQSAPVGAKLRMGVNAARGAAVRCFTSMRCNVALAAGASGLQALLDGVDWVMDEGGKPVKVSSPPVNEVTPCSTSSVCYTSNQPNRPPTSNIMATCVHYLERGLVVADARESGNTTQCLYGTPANPSQYGWDGNRSGYTRTQSGQAPTISAPVSVSDIESGVQSNYTPEPSDLPWFSPGIDLSADDVVLDITDAPSFQEHVGTKTIYDADGNPIEIQDTNIWHNFSPVDNPGKQPGLKDVETEEVDRYGPGGEPLGSTTTVVTRPPATEGSPPTDFPVDCDLMPSLCTWMDWTQDGWDDPGDPDFEDLRQVIDLRDYEESVVIGPGLMACPEPLALYIPYLDVEVGISYQPFCSLADLLRPLLIALSYFAGAVLLVRSI